MIDHLKSIAVFAVAVQERSFRGAARRLALSPSVISHHVASLEKSLGVSLIYRSTRSFSLTADGERFYKSASAMMDAASDGIGAFSEQSDARITQLRIAIPEALAFHEVFTRLTNYAKTNAGVQLMLTSSDTSINLVRETIDVAVRVGRLKDSDFRARKISEEDLMIVASSDYCKKRKRVTHPDGLADWNYIEFTPAPGDIEFTKGSKTIRPHFGNPVAVTDSIQVRYQLALAGLGLAGLPKTLIRDDLKSGRLRAVLPAWQDNKMGVYLLWHKNTATSSSTRGFINYMAGSS